MANRLNTENIFVPDIDTDVFTSESDQIVFLEIWNFGLHPENVSINGFDFTVCNCTSVDAHRFDKIEMKSGDKITLKSEKKETLKYNIIK